MYEPTETEKDISEQVLRIVAPNDAASLATALGASEEAIRKKFRGERPWSRLDLLKIVKLTGRPIHIRPLKQSEESPNSG